MPKGVGWSKTKVCTFWTVNPVEEGLEQALNPRPKNLSQLRKIDGEAEAHLIAMACSQAPPGYHHWTLRLLAEKMVALEYVDSLSHESVRQVLKKTK